TGRFVEYDDLDQTQINYIRTLARIAHLASHALSTAIYLSEKGIYHIARLEKWFKYAPVFSAMGFALWTTSLVWQSYSRRRDNPHMLSDLGIHAGGLVFQAFPILDTFKFATQHLELIKKISSVAGIIHAWSFIQRLNPPQQENLTGEWRMPSELNNTVVGDEDHDLDGEEVEDHDHDHGHNHQDHLHFYPLC
ncbi:MAG: hypothetical protein K2X39_07295, partial [Silvanigrellaceae bacterium]|nr:hypothetical protein [Silvanigrellaceae bacterium]